MSQRNLTEEEEFQLFTLNELVAQAIAARTKWLDAKMVECSSLKVGDDIYDLRTGQKVGTVCRVYRYWAHYGELYDTCPYWDYDYEIDQHPQCFDNTPRQSGGHFFGTKEEARRAMLSKADSLQRKWA